MDMVSSDEPSSDATSLQSLKVCPTREASCSARKRSPLSVQSRMVTAGRERRRRSPATCSPGAALSPASSDVSNMPREPSSLRLLVQKKHLLPGEILATRGGEPNKIAVQYGFMEPPLSQHCGP